MASRVCFHTGCFLTNLQNCKQTAELPTCTVHDYEFYSDFFSVTRAVSKPYVEFVTRA